MDCNMKNLRHLFVELHYVSVCGRDKNNVMAATKGDDFSDRLR